MIWLVGEHRGHNSPLSSVFLPLCVDGTERGQKHGKEESLCSAMILHRCIGKNKIISGFPTVLWNGVSLGKMSKELVGSWVGRKI